MQGLTNIGCYRKLQWPQILNLLSNSSNISRMLLRKSVSTPKIIISIYPTFIIHKNSYTLAYYLCQKICFYCPNKFLYFKHGLRRNSDLQECSPASAVCFTCTSILAMRKKYVKHIFLIISMNIQKIVKISIAENFCVACQTLISS